MDVREIQNQLYQLRKFNRQYIDEIHLLVNKVRSLETRIQLLERDRDTLDTENIYFKNQIDALKIHSADQISNSLQAEVCYIRNCLEEILRLNTINCDKEDIFRENQIHDKKGPVHRPIQEKYHPSGLGKEYIVRMNEKNKKNVLPHGLRKSEAHSLETSNKNQKVIEQLAKVVKNVGDQKQPTRQDLLQQATTNQEKLISKKPSSNITFKELQGAQRVYSKSTGNKNAMTSSVKKQTHTNFHVKRDKQKAHVVEIENEPENEKEMNALSQIEEIGPREASTEQIENQTKQQTEVIKGDDIEEREHISLFKRMWETLFNK